jgi:hypothetical protein
MAKRRLTKVEKVETDADQAREEATRREFRAKEAIAQAMARHEGVEWHITGASPRFWARLFVTKDGLVDFPPSMLWWTHRKRWDTVKAELQRRGWHGKRAE